MIRSLLAAAWFLAATALPGTDVVVQVTGIASNEGEVGCALFSSPKGFPMDSSGSAAQWLAASTDGVVCRFQGLTPGVYAVAVSHDLNGNRKTDTRMFGLPVEDWGVSNSVRHRIRPPNFKEASFRVAEGETKSLVVRLGR